MANDAANNFYDNLKTSTVFTPYGVCRFIFDKIESSIFYSKEIAKIRSSKILDIACGTGNLSKYFFLDGFKTTGIDISNFQERKYIDDFIKTDFMTVKSDDIKPDLILCNPPWNIDGNSTSNYIDVIKEYLETKNRPLLPDAFIRKIFEVYGNKMPVVFLVPFGFRLNLDKTSNRYSYLRDCGARITSICSLPKNIFPNVKWQCEILFFNIDGLEPHYFLEKKYLAGNDELFLFKEDGFIETKFQIG